MQRPTVIFTNGGGRMSNQLLNQAHLISWANEKELGLISVPFWSYTNHYKSFTHNPACKFGSVSSNQFTFLFSFCQRITSFSFNNQRRIQKTLKALLRSYSKLNTSWQDVRSYDFNNKNAQYESIDLGSIEFNKLIEDKKVTLLSGWNIRNWGYFEKHQNTIRELFQPKDELIEESNTLISHLKKDSDLTVGVFIRRGDYRSYMDGRYFFDFPVYDSWMQQLVTETPDKIIAFIVSSEEVIPEGSFKSNLNIQFSSGSANKGGTAIQTQYELSQCDYIISVPSTFSAWSAFMGKKPLIPLIASNQHISITNAVSTIFELVKHAEFSAVIK